MQSATTPTDTASPKRADTSTPLTAAEVRPTSSAGRDEIIARQFAVSLAVAPPRTIRPLPDRWRPLATAIVGDRPVVLRTDAVSRRALSDAGKVAATTDNVIHLRREPTSHADAAILAHELTHVANPSPAPRFYDDARPSAEERQAEQLADIIRRSPVLPHPGGATPLAARERPDVSRLSSSPILGGALAGTVRRASSPSGDGSISAADLAARLTGSGSSTADGSARSGSSTSRSSSRGASSSSNTIRRSAGIARSTRASSSSSSASGSGGSSSSTGRAAAAIGGAGVIRRAIDDQHAVDDQPHVRARSEESWEMLKHTVDSSGVTDLVEWIVDRLEERIRDDLARRGGRHRREF